VPASVNLLTEARLGRKIDAGWYGIEATLTFTAKKNCLRRSILNKEGIRMIFNKSVIIRNKFMNGDKIFLDIRNMQDIVENKRLRRARNLRLTNVSNMQTCTIGNLDVVFAGVPLMESKVIEIAG
jgi:hypothetical protein